jgi:glycine oxidase
MHILVIGGGVIGCAVAYYLAKAGARVTVVERGEIGGEASGAAAGMLTPLGEGRGPGPFLDLALASLRLFPPLIQELAGETGIDIQYQATGVLRVAIGPGDIENLRQHFAWQRNVGMPLHWLEAEAVRAVEPKVSPRVRAAILSPEEHQLGPGRLVQAFAAAARRRDACLQPETPVRGFLRRGDRVIGIRTPNASLAADHVVLAAGPWTQALARHLGVVVPTHPVRGQMLALPALSRPLRHIVWGPQGYLTPKPGAFVWVGATVEDVGFRRRVTRKGLHWLRRVIRSLVPALAYSEIASTWAALRPGNPDGLPILGALPGWENVSVATGHFRNGILLAPITGQLMAQHILEDKTKTDLTPFSPNRFR